MHTLTKQRLLQFLQEIDRAAITPLHITVLGGASILLLDFRERVTVDIDIAATPDARIFQKLSTAKGIPVDIVTVSSTVDLLRCPTTIAFKGRRLVIYSVTAEDLLKLKLERFHKHDPEDIYSILDHLNLPFERFKAIALDMLPDFIGNPRTLALSICLVVERRYPNHIEEIKNLLLS